MATGTKCGMLQSFTYQGICGKMEIEGYSLKPGDKIVRERDKIYIIRNKIKLGPIVKREQDKT